MFLEFLGLRHLLLQGGMINMILQKIGFGEVKYFYSALAYRTVNIVRVVTLGLS